MNIPAELHDPVVRLLRQKGLVRAETVADCKRIAEHRQTMGERVTTLDVLVEAGQIQPEQAEQLAAQCAPEAVSAAKKPIGVGVIGIAVVGVPVLVILGYMAIKPRHKAPPRMPVSNGPREFDVAEVALVKKSGEKTPDEIAAEVKYKAFLEEQAKKTATVGRAPTLAAGQAGFVSDRSQLVDPDLHVHFVPFSFAYPSAWTLESAGGAKASRFYARVTRKEAGSEVVLESFTVMPFWYSKPPRNAKESVRNSVSRLEEALFPKMYPGYQRIREGDMKVAGYEGLGIEGEGQESAEKGSPKVYVRLIILPPGTANQTHGLAVIQILSARVPEVKGIEDLGTKGELPAIVPTLAIGG